MTRAFLIPVYSSIVQVVQASSEQHAECMSMSIQNHIDIDARMATPYLLNYGGGGTSQKFEINSWAQGCPRSCGCSSQYPVALGVGPFRPTTRGPKGAIPNMRRVSFWFVCTCARRQCSPSEGPSRGEDENGTSMWSLQRRPHLFEGPN